MQCERDLCHADYVGYTRQQLFSASTEISINGEHLRAIHNQMLKDSHDQFLFTILQKCSGKLDCLIYKMLFTKET